MALRISDYRFWLLFGVLATALLIACSSDTTPGPSGQPDANEGVADSMTQS
jgi:hypothetical protein